MSSDSPDENTISKRSRRRVTAHKTNKNSSQDDLSETEFAELQERAMKNRHKWKKQKEQCTTNNCLISQIAYITYKPSISVATKRQLEDLNSQKKRVTRSMSQSASSHAPITTDADVDDGVRCTRSKTHQINMTNLISPIVDQISNSVIGMYVR